MQATASRTSTGQAVSTVVDSWNGVVFLVRELDRKGRLVYVVRLEIGNFNPWKYGPFAVKSEAMKCFKLVTQETDDAIGELQCNAAVYSPHYSEQW